MANKKLSGKPNWPTRKSDGPRKMAGFNSPASVKARLQAVLYYDRKKRKEAGDGSGS